MQAFHRLNTLVGWVVFLVAALTYFSTIEPSASFWDCGEYVATAYKLEVGHPPGAPLFNLLGRFFSLFGDKTMAAHNINIMSALMSAFTILFLFWTITALGRKWVLRTSSELTPAQLITILGSGAVGALAYTFSDSFWFSAVEGEVYASSSFFTAIVFWAILKWEEVADEPHADRWIVFIAYLIGLSIGIHLLNLLAIPAIVFVYYHKKKKEDTRKGFWLTLLLSLVILGIVQSGIIPQVVNLAAKFELFFVNTIGLPFNSGTVIFFVLLAAGIVWGLRYTRRTGRSLANTLVLGFTFLLIGYSSFFILIIRSSANTPMDENNPENAVNLLSYLNREQYGDWPILYGQYFNSPLDPENPYKDGNPIYEADKKTGKYVVTYDRKSTIPNYDKRFCTLFPRMWDDQRAKIAGYKEWSEYVGTPVQATQNGEPTTIMKPTFSENLKFFFAYQLNHMYLRYFMWNFAGRQNDIQGHGGLMHGNWISGLDGIDAIRLGDQSKLPELWKQNKGRNQFYFLPLILGLLGMFFHFKKDRNDAFVVFLMFAFTGLAIALYLNMAPYQPRERDYAFVGSFYAFAIWIGLGVFAIQDWLSKRLSASAAGAVATSVGLLMGPTLMAKDGWDDHDRSNRYTARDFAFDYLDSCAPNAILFTNGDNDTFPLWYAQEVEGYRTDVRVVNLSLSNTDWYIEQMRRKAYDSDPVPMTLRADQIRQGTRDYVPIYPNSNVGIDTNKFYNINELLSWIGSDDPTKEVPTQAGKSMPYMPTNKVFIPVDSATIIQSKTVEPKNASEIVKGGINWTINKSYLMKNDLMIFDIIATNNWKRPIYFAITVGDDSYMDLQEYFQLEGLAYRLVPIRTLNQDGQTGKVATELMYKNLMKTFKWGGMDSKPIYMDENNIRMTMNLRNNFARLADQLSSEGDKKRAVEVLDKCMAVMPEKTVPYNYFMMSIAEAYYRSDSPEKANLLVTKLADQYEDELEYYLSLKGKQAALVENETQRAMYVMNRLVMMTGMFKQNTLNKQLEARFKKLESRYSGA